MIYQLEKNLQDDLQYLVSEYEIKKNNDSFLRREVPVSECVPDLVTIRFDKRPNIKQWPSKWSAKFSFLLWLLRSSEKLNLDEIAKLYSSSSKRIEPIIHDLLKTEIIQESKGYYFLGPDYSEMKVEVVAFEAKLSRWREALIQGIRYKKFADKVIVAMDPGGLPKRKSSYNLFIENEIGLCEITQNRFKLLISPGINKNLNFENEYLVTSALIPKRNSYWFSMNDFTAASHA